MENQEIRDVTAGLNVWILSDGKKGHENQSLGVAEALGVESPKILTLKKRPLSGFLSYVYPTLGVSNLPQGPFPDLVIATGNLTAPITQYIKLQSPETVVVQMMRGRKPYDVYDALIVPHYDGVKAAANVLTTVGAPNRITQEKLTEAHDKWKVTFSHLKEKRLAVLIGGDSSRYTFDETQAQQFADEVLTLAERGDYSIMATASRRTGLEEYELLKKAFEGEQNFFWDDEGENPYFGMLSHADAIVVTAESISMVSEACTTGKPVYVFGAGAEIQGKAWGKFNAFFQTLKSQRRIKALGTGDLDAPEQPLADTQKVAGFIRAKLQQMKSTS